MRDIEIVSTPVHELPHPVAWDEAMSKIGTEVDYPLCAADWDRVSTPVYCWEGIQATLCPLAFAQLDPAKHPEGALAMVADGYVYVIHSAEELEAIGQC